MKNERRLFIAFFAALTLTVTQAFAQTQTSTSADAQTTRPEQSASPGGQSDEGLPNFYQVNAGLYRGGQPGAEGLRRLAGMGIKTVVNLRDDDERARAEGEEASALGLRYFNLPLGRFGRPELETVERVLALLNAPENQPVFVHCARGADRTGTVIAAYRIAHDGWTSEEAKREAKHYGLKFWQRGMKDFIHDYYEQRRQTPHASALTADPPPLKPSAPNAYLHILPEPIGRASAKLTKAFKLVVRRTSSLAGL